MFEVLVVGGVFAARAGFAVLPKIGVVEALAAQLLLVRLLALARLGAEPVPRDVGETPQRLHGCALLSVLPTAAPASAPCRSAGVSSSKGMPARWFTVGSVV